MTNHGPLQILRNTAVTPDACRRNFIREERPYSFQHHPLMQTKKNQRKTTTVEFAIQSGFWQPDLPHASIGMLRRKQMPASQSW